MFTYSIIIPHYNSISLLLRMINSIPEREDIQVVVVDDCSPNSVKEELSKIKHLNLELYLQTVNLGAGAARNVGLRHATGKWVLVVDSDDIFVHNAFDILDQYKDENIDYFCFCIKTLDTHTLEPNNIKITSDKSVRKYIENPSSKNLTLFKFKNTVCWNKMVRFDFIKKYNIRFEECKVNNDVLFTYYLAIYGKTFKVINKDIYCFLENKTSITRQKRGIEREFMFYIMQQKRNGLFRKMKLGYPFYRSDLLYVFFYIKKMGVVGAYHFFKYRSMHLDVVMDAQKEYLRIFNGVDFTRFICS